MLSDRSIHQAYSGLSHRCPGSNCCRDVSDISDTSGRCAGVGFFTKLGGHDDDFLCFSCSLCRICWGYKSFYRVCRANAEQKIEQWNDRGWACRFGIDSLECVVGKSNLAENTLGFSTFFVLLLESNFFCALHRFDAPSLQNVNALSFARGVPHTGFGICLGSCFFVKKIFRPWYSFLCWVWYRSKVIAVVDTLLFAKVHRVFEHWLLGYSKDDPVSSEDLQHIVPLGYGITGKSIIQNIKISLVPFSCTSRSAAT